MKRREFGKSLGLVAGVVSIPSIALGEECEWTVEQGIYICKNEEGVKYFNTGDMAAICNSPILVNENGINYVKCDENDTKLMEFMHCDFGFHPEVPHGFVHTLPDNPDWSEEIQAEGIRKIINSDLYKRNKGKLLFYKGTNQHKLINIKRYCEKYNS